MFSSFKFVFEGFLFSSYWMLVEDTKASFEGSVLVFCSVVSVFLEARGGLSHQYFSMKFSNIKNIERIIE